MKILSFGSYTFPLIEPRDDFGNQEPLSPLALTPYGPVDVLGDEDIAYSADTLVKEFDLLASTPSALATALDAVRALRGKRDVLTIQTYAGSSRWAYARCMNVRYSRTRRNFNWQRVGLRFLVEQNLWNGTAQNTTAGKTTGQTIVINNGGNANVDDMRVEITAPAGNSISTIVVECATAGVKITYGGTVAASEVLVLDSGEWLVTNHDNDDYGNLALSPGHAIAHLFRLLPGNNTYTLTFTGGGTAQFRYIFNDLWK